MGSLDPFLLRFGNLTSCPVAMKTVVILIGMLIGWNGRYPSFRKAKSLEQGIGVQDRAVDGRKGPS